MWYIVSILIRRFSSEILCLLCKALREARIVKFDRFILNRGDEL